MKITVKNFGPIRDQSQHITHVQTNKTLRKLK